MPSKRRTPAGSCPRDQRPQPGRIAVSVDEAAQLIGISTPPFREHVLPHLRTVRIGRRVLIPVRDLDHWVDANAVLLGTHR